MYTLALHCLDARIHSLLLNVVNTNWNFHLNCEIMFKNIDSMDSVCAFA